MHRITHVHIAAVVAKFLLLPDEERERKTSYYDKKIPKHSYMPPSLLLALLVWFFSPPHLIS